MARSKTANGSVLSIRCDHDVRTDQPEFLGQQTAENGFQVHERQRDNVGSNAVTKLCRSKLQTRQDTDLWVEDPHANNTNTHTHIHTHAITVMTFSSSGKASDNWPITVSWCSWYL